MKYQMEKTGWSAVGAALALAVLFAPGRSARAVSATVVVNEVMPNDVGDTSREFVEIKNVSNQDLHLDLYTLEYRSAGNGTVIDFYTFPAGSVIPANGYYLVLTTTYHSTYPTIAYNDLYPGPLGGTINSSGSVGILDAQKNRIDSVAFGNITAVNHPFVETKPEPSVISSGLSIERVAGTDGLIDHDDNSIDFGSPNTPTPTTTPWVANIPVVSPVTVSPARIETGASALVTATVTQTVNPVTGVTIDLTPIGGGAAVPMTHGSGNTWTTTITIPSGQTAGNYTLLIKANDSGGKYGSGGASFFVNPGAPLTVAQARAATPATGQSAIVRVRGIVIATRTGNAYIADADGSAGIDVSDGNAQDGVAPLVVGQNVTVTGTLALSTGTDQNEDKLTTANGTTADIIINSSGNALPPYLPITLDDLNNNNALQGRLVSIAGVVAQPYFNTVVTRVNGTTGDGVCLISLGTSPISFVAVSRNATDQASVPYPGLPSIPIPAVNDPLSGFTIPWIQAGDTFNVRGIAGNNSVGLNKRVLRVTDATDLVMVSGARFISGSTLPSPAEQGRKAEIRVLAYPLSVNTVTADLSGLGLGSIVLSDDGPGAYTGVVTIPAGAALGDVSVPVTVVNGDASDSGSFTLTVGPPTSHPGDVDQSGGAATVADVALALKVAGGLTAGNSASVSVPNGDVSPKSAPDGKLTLEDAARILRSIQGLDTL